METHDWQLIQEHKIRKCVEEQLATEDKMETLTQLAMDKARLEISQGNKAETPVEIETNQDQAAIDTYDTVLAANVTEDSKGNLITKEPDKIMSILTNPMRDDEDIDESEASMYYRVQQVIDREMADLVQGVSKKTGNRDLKLYLYTKYCK
jgi:hypothetical protein